MNFVLRNLSVVELLELEAVGKTYERRHKKKLRYIKNKQTKRK
jgi:hypothetical protein